MEGSQAIPLNPKRQKSANPTKSAPYLGFVPSKSAEIEAVGAPRHDGLARAHKAAFGPSYRCATVSHRLRARQERRGEERSRNPRLFRDD